jgi:hypothetical protein
LQSEAISSVPIIDAMFYKQLESSAYLGEGACKKGLMEKVFLEG